MSNLVMSQSVVQFVDCRHPNDIAVQPDTKQISKMEVQGIFVGLLIAKHWNLKKIMVKTDSLEAWQQITQNLNQAYDFTEGLEEIKALLDHNCEMEFTHNK